MAKQRPSEKSAGKPKTGSKPKIASTAKMSLTAGVNKKKAKATKIKEMRDNTDPMFGKDLLSHRARLHFTGNVGALEQLVFLTEPVVRAPEALNRLLQHGFDNETLVYLLSKSRQQDFIASLTGADQSRVFPKYPLKANSMGVAIRGVMRQSGHNDWTLGGYQHGLYSDTKWDVTNLTLTGVRLHCEQFPDKHGHRDPIDNVLFEALAVDVTRFPEGDDALDLTRCMIWIVNNPGSGLQFPRDFPWLTNELGGPQPVAKTNQDRAVFSRWSAAHKTWKTAVAKARSAIKKAEKSKTTLRTPRARDRQAEVGEAATAELQELVTPPTAIATKVNDLIVINTARIPPPIPGPSPLAVAQRLARCTLPPALPVIAQPAAGHLPMQSFPPPTLPVIAQPMASQLPVQSWSFPAFPPVAHGDSSIAESPLSSGPATPAYDLADENGAHLEASKSSTFQSAFTDGAVDPSFALGGDEDFFWIHNLATTIQGPPNFPDDYAFEGLTGSEGLQVHGGFDVLQGHGGFDVLQDLGGFDGHQDHGDFGGL
jgi:hypothetical protein